MVSTETFQQMALSFPEAVEQPHFEKTSFRVKKKIFATMSVENKEAMVKLSAVDQSVLCAIDNTIIYPVPGTWGKQGSTTVNLKKIKKDLLKDVLSKAYCNVAPKKLCDLLNRV